MSSSIWQKLQRQIFRIVEFKYLVHTIAKRNLIIISKKYIFSKDKNTKKKNRENYSKDWYN